MDSCWSDACRSAQSCYWQYGRQRMFREEGAGPNLGLNVSVCWTCAGDCKLAPAPHAHSKGWLELYPFSPLC